MAIIVNIDVVMARRKMSLNELAERVNITPVNLSILKTGKAKAIRFPPFRLSAGRWTARWGKSWNTCRLRRRKRRSEYKCRIKIGRGKSSQSTENHK